SQDKFNVSSYKVTFMVIISLQAFVGMWINAFVVSVLCIGLVKKKTFNSNEKILLFLGCSRFWFLCITWVYYFLTIIYPWCFHIHPIPQLFAAFQSFFNSSNLWVSACLCIFYCIKIVNFRYIFFFYLKAKIDRIVSWLLLGSVVLSLLVSILAYNFTDETHYNSSTKYGNFWKLDLRTDQYFFPLFFISGFEFATAFMAVILSALPLLFSLWRHKCKMQTNSEKTLSMDANIKAIKSVLAFLVIYTINFTCLILTLIYLTKNESLLMFLILVFQYAFPALHSLILIFSNPKLEKTLLKTLHCVKGKVCMR
ncbi:TA2R9 protein, partial [Chordeiles acutipennis]|nr:TA2R9 protein [Chordeiles acutipennis]